MKGIVGREAEIRELQERYSSDRAQQTGGALQTVRPVLHLLSSLCARQ